jgi:serine/threonine protein kinase
MTIDSVETLLAVLQRVNLLVPEEANEIARELVPHFPDPHDLIEYLVQNEWLTPFQMQLLFTDRWDELAVGPYVLMDQLGQGGVSEVFKAWDTVKGRLVALKVLHRDLCLQPDVVEQFRRELQTVLRLSHPNIIKTFDADYVGSTDYFAMEFVEGMDLERYVRQVGPLPVDQACDYVRQVALGLQHAHQTGLVHRDIKPANLFLINPPQPATPGGNLTRRGPDPLVKILDWGLARLRPTEEHTAGMAPIDEDAEKGALIGTADYIAPEQAQDATLVDIRADIYSLGCVFYFLLTGQPPFKGNSLMQKLLQHRDAERPRVREVRPDVPEEVGAMVQRMMARSPEERYAIPLLIVTPLRRFCLNASAPTNVLGRAGANGAVRPPSSAELRISSPSNGHGPHGT